MKLTTEAVHEVTVTESEAQVAVLAVIESEAQVVVLLQGKVQSEFLKQREAIVDQ